MKPRQYTPPTKYTAEELAIAYMSDVAVDIACAHRDNQPEYAESCERELEQLKANFRTNYGTEPVLLPFATAYDDVTP